MKVLTRRAWLLMACSWGVAGCSKPEVVVGPDAGGGKKGMKNREEAEIKDRRRGKAQAR